MGSEPRPPAPFIVGASRSGTTLLRLMLDGHPDVAIPPETHFVGRLAGVWQRSERPALEALEAIVADEHWPDFGLDREALAQRIGESPIAGLGDVLRCFYGLYAAGHGKVRWGDKTPQYVLRMPMIAAILPEARFIHMIRDGRDVALSVIPMWFGPRSIEEAAGWWKERIRAAQRDRAIVEYEEVRYEHLVAQPGNELRRLCEFLSLDFHEEMLAYHRRASARMSEIKDQPVADAALAQAERARLRERTRALLGRPPLLSQVGRWHTEMSRDDRRRFVAVAGDLLEELGYPLSPPAAPERAPRRPNAPPRPTPDTSTS